MSNVLLFIVDTFWSIPHTLIVQKSSDLLPFASIKESGLSLVPLPFEHILMWQRTILYLAF